MGNPRICRVIHKVERRDAEKRRLRTPKELSVKPRANAPGICRRSSSSSNKLPDRIQVNPGLAGQLSFAVPGVDMCRAFSVHDSGLAVNAGLAESVGLRQAPKARSIPAWGNAPGNKVQFQKRAVSPPYTIMERAFSPSIRRDCVFLGRCPRLIWRGPSARMNSTVGRSFTAGAAEVPSLWRWDLWLAKLASEKARSDATRAARAREGVQRLILRQAPKARSIPAWGNAPGNKVQFQKRAVSPPYTIMARASARSQFNRMSAVWMSKSAIHAPKDEGAAQSRVERR